MMKKLLLLVSFLSIVSVANATLTISLNGNTDISDITIYASDYITVGIHSNDTLNWLAYLDVTDDQAIATRISSGFTDKAGPDSNYSEYAYPPYWEYEVTMADYEGITTQPGVQFEVVLHCEGTGNIDLVMYDEFVNLIGTATIVQEIPEPMTICLLGLGGLLFRRRRKLS